MSVCVRECVSVCMCVCAPGAPPAPPARRRAPRPLSLLRPLPAARCTAALDWPPPPGAAPRARPPPRTPQALTRPRLEGPRSFTARFVQTMEDVTHSARAPRVAVDSQAAGSPRWPPPPRCPLDSVPKGVEIRPVFSARWPLEGVSSGLRTAEDQGRRVEMVRCRNR
ncbi:proline-rich protein 36-like [Alexandromys fortis]|uniref:proline-rich protein 36-like n=1 Tax=Alexandromys fortis TaxID=100897 RepID=UPI00215352B0|nr:proline-rich protein 36-like [Microtus fortis]